MFHKSHLLNKQLVVATALALGASGIALADDSSMNPFIGDSYKYFNGSRNLGDPGPFNRPVYGTAPADPSWRQSHPNGLTERDLQALSSSGLSASATQRNAPLSRPQQRIHHGVRATRMAWLRVTCRRCRRPHWPGGNFRTGRREWPPQQPTRLMSRRTRARIRLRPGWDASCKPKQGHGGKPTSHIGRPATALATARAASSERALPRCGPCT